MNLGKIIRCGLRCFKQLIAWSLLLYVIIIVLQTFGIGGPDIKISPQFSAILDFYQSWRVTFLGYSDYYGQVYPQIAFLVIHGAMLALWWRWK